MRLMVDGTLRHPKRATKDGHPAPALLLIALGIMALAHFPGGIVGRCRDHANLMPLLGKPSRHLAGIFTDADELGGEIQAQNEDLHRLPFDWPKAGAA